MLDHAPRFRPADAERIARDLFAREGRARELPSERDQNFVIESPDGERIVLKIANALEEPSILEAQHLAMAHLAPRMPGAPHVVATRTGAALGTTDGSAGRRHLLWAVTHLPGVPLATIAHRPPALLEDLGARIGALAGALHDFEHPAIRRDFYWDLANGRRIVAERRSAMSDAALGEAIDVVIAAFDRHVAPRLSSLRRGAIHNDLNDHNLLVEADPRQPPRVVGIVDFGDMVHGWIVADLAVAAAYAMLDVRDPLAVLGHLVRGYHAVHPLTEPELEALFGLACLRLAMSACIAAEQRLARPDNEYLSVSQEAIRRTLPALAAIPYGLATAVARDAAGLEPVAGAAAVREWLRRETRSFAPVLADHDLRTERCVVLDLGPSSSLVSADARENAEPMLTPRIADVVRAAGVRIGVGRYDEPRLLYTAPFFTSATGERRTIHIGLDLFAAAGTPVYAPLEGTVHAVADNAVLHDYGPVVVLRHLTTDGLELFTLFGHLSRASLDGLEVGRHIARGERFASLGSPNENVGWTPHLHLQVITDLLGLGCDFPGVAPASQRAVWRSLSPDPNLIVGIPSERLPAAMLDRAATLAARRRRLGDNVSIAYRDPVKIVRGWMQYLYDDDGRRYIDAYNNVPHVGHCHPRVVEAGQRQMAVLNTNTRYLSELLNDYAARLLATFPEPLHSGRAFFVNSASEANELALRLARAHTQRRDMIVLGGAYHGNTTSLIDLSPYKHAGPAGRGAPDWVHVAPLADDYRGPYKRSDPEAGRKYASQVAEVIEALAGSERRVCGFIAESCPSVGGQIVFPPGYLSAVYGYVREAGGVCIADEVQTGLGRIGTHFWAFEAQGVVPDIVVMGKPLGNGHPIGAVVTTEAIARSFDNGMEYFSTFGGNTVSCAIGVAVLDVLRDDALPAHAMHVGERMLERLRSFPGRYPVVGDVRGSGLFLGVELVRDRESLEPAADEASYVANRMREEGILLGTDGPYHNVVKIRPPMPFGSEDADRLVDTLEHILAAELSR